LSRTLTWANVLVSGIALFLACAAFVVYSVVTFRDMVVRDLSVQAQIIGTNSISAIVFDDAIAAGSTLSALAAAPNVVTAGVYLPDGTAFATYRTGPGDSAATPGLRPDEDERSWFDGGYVHLARAVFLEGEPVAVVFIQSDLRQVNVLLIRYLMIAMAVLVGSLAAALLISSRFRRSVTGPIIGLAETAQIISREKDYAVRAEPAETEDEVAVLVRAFNEMLDHIQGRDEELAEARERLDLSLRSAGIGTWHLDLVRARFLMDDYSHPLFGLPPGTSVRRLEDFIGLVHPDDREETKRRLRDSLAGDAPFGMEFRVLRGEPNEARILSSRGKVYKNREGAAVAMTGVCWDITELKRTERAVRVLNEELEHRVEARTQELEAANNELQAFTYSVAHDLRAPLRHIHGFSRMLMEEYGAEMDDGARGYLEDILQGTQRMGRLIDDLLALGRVGRQDLSLQLTGLGSLVAETLESARQEAQGRNIEWKINDLPFVMCDPGLIRQVFTNLFSNSVKYTGPRKHAVIEVGQVTLDGETAVYVRDNGVGFDMQYASKLFGVFQRLHRREDFEGTGVGLATVQRILLKHGGRIWAEAELDKGATFYFTLKGFGEDARPVGENETSEVLS